MTEALRKAWAFLRRLSGDDAYERYLIHCRHTHRDDSPVMSRAAFFRAEQRRKWQGVSRCC